MGASPSKPDESNSTKAKKRKSAKATGQAKSSKMRKSTTLKSKESKKSKVESKSNTSGEATESQPSHTREPERLEAKEESTTTCVTGLPQWKPERINNIEWPPKVGKSEKEPIPVRAGSVLAAVRAAESTGKSCLAIAAAAATSVKERTNVDGAAVLTPDKKKTDVVKTSSQTSAKLVPSSEATKKKLSAGKTKKGETTKKAKKKKKVADTNSVSSGSKTAKASKKTKKTANKKNADKPTDISTIREHDSSTPRDATTVTTEPATVSSTQKTEMLTVNQSSSANARMSSWAKMLRGEANLLGKSVGDGNDHSESRDAVSTLTRPDSATDAEPKTKFGGAVRAARLAFRRELGRDQGLEADGGLEETSHGVPSSILRERLSGTGGTLMERIKLAVARELEEAAEEVDGNAAAKLQLDAELLRLLSFLVSL